MSTEKLYDTELTLIHIDMGIFLTDPFHYEYMNKLKYVLITK